MLRRTTPALLIQFAHYPNGDTINHPFSHKTRICGPSIFGMDDAREPVVVRRRAIGPSLTPRVGPNRGVACCQQGGLKGGKRPKHRWIEQLEFS